MQPRRRRHQPERICAFYSKGPHYVRMLQRLRKEYPGETIIAAIPTGFPFHVIERLVDETVRVSEVGESSAIARQVTVIRRLRRARCTHLVVMFDSPRLNLLARLSGTGRGWLYSVDGRLQVLDRPLVALLLTPLFQRIQGEWAYVLARLGTSRRARRRE